MSRGTVAQSESISSREVALAVFNWNKMPDELRKALLADAGLDPDLSTVRWCGLLEDERKALNQLLAKKSGGASSFEENPR